MNPLSAQYLIHCLECTSPHQHDGSILLTLTKKSTFQAIRNSCVNTAIDNMMDNRVLKIDLHLSMTSKPIYCKPSSTPHPYGHLLHPPLTNLLQITHTAAIRTAVCRLDTNTQYLHTKPKILQHANRQNSQHPSHPLHKHTPRPTKRPH